MLSALQAGSEREQSTAQLGRSFRLESHTHMILEMWLCYDLIYFNILLKSQWILSHNLYVVPNKEQRSWFVEMKKMYLK